MIYASFESDVNSYNLKKDNKITWKSTRWKRDTPFVACLSTKWCITVDLYDEEVQDMLWKVTYGTLLILESMLHYSIIGWLQNKQQDFKPTLFATSHDGNLTVFANIYLGSERARMDIFHSNLRAM